MSELSEFGLIVLVVAGAFTAAVSVSRLTQRFPLPGPAIFLLLAAVASDVFPRLDDHVSIKTVERIGVVALIVILFDGGMHVGWRRFRRSAPEIAALGVVGTFAMAAAMAAAAHYAFDFDWTTAWIVGAALAPTDPAVMFSVLGNREIGGRAGTVLEGEAGANAPVGIALMIGILEFATHDGASIWIVVREFALEMTVGLAAGIAGAALLLPVMRRFTLPREELYAIRTLAAAGVIYGAASVAGGSGFLAVFVAGLLIGDARAPYKAEIERFHTSLASLAEIAVFVVLGLTIDLTDLGKDRLWLDGLLLALILVAVRPLVVAPLLALSKLSAHERLFVMWGGLKGAVPILLAAFALLAGVEDASRIYGIVFVVVALSVVVQGTSIPAAASLLHIPMRASQPQSERRYVVAPGSRAVGASVRNLPLGEGAWILRVVRKGGELRAKGSAVLEAGDEVEAVVDLGDAELLRRLFEGGPGTRRDRGG